MDTFLIFYNPFKVHYSSLLSDLLRQQRRGLQIKKNIFGKPFLSDRSFYFNVSHKKNIAVLAVNKNYEIGIDIEFKNLEIRAPQKVLHSLEKEILLSLPYETRKRKILEVFCKKEAILKAKGVGISTPPESVDLSCFIEKDQFFYEDYENLYLVTSFSFHECFVAVAVNLRKTAQQPCQYQGY